MDHIITDVKEIQVGDVLKLYSNKGVTDEKPHGERQYVSFDANIPTTNNHQSRPNPESIMNNRKLNQRVMLNMPTGEKSMRVLEITHRFIMVDMLKDADVEISNVIIDRETFEWTFLKPAVWSCYKMAEDSPNGTGTQNIYLVSYP